MPPTDAAAGQLPPSKYTTAVPLGKGATGEVFEAYDAVLKRPVALKWLRRDDPALAQRMLREARAQARVEHPNVCRVYDVGELGGRPYIAMQLVKGETLEQAARGMSLEHKLRTSPPTSSWKRPATAASFRTCSTSASSTSPARRG
jgi:serine/threonine-protein kinase